MFKDVEVGAAYNIHSGFAPRKVGAKSARSRRSLRDHSRLVTVIFDVITLLARRHRSAA